jgi:hypothetical protein
MKTFRLDGTMLLNTSFGVKPLALVRICGDGLVSYTGSWADTLLINFTTNSAFAQMTLPAEVKADVYAVWNKSTFYDFFLPAPTLPLRFNTDPASIFLPTDQKE